MPERSAGPHMACSSADALPLSFRETQRVGEPQGAAGLRLRLHELRWAFDISIIIVDLMYFSAFDVVLTVFQCVLGHSTRST